MGRSGIVAFVFLGACSFSRSDGVLPDDAPPTPPDEREIDAPPDGPARIRRNLIAFYDFNETSGTTVRDTSPENQHVDLTIADETKVMWGNGRLTILQRTPIASQESVPCFVNQRGKASDAITVEVWVVPANANQTGQSGEFARVVTSSINAVGRNFAIGQSGTEWALQARTANANVGGQGSPIIAGGTVVATETQLVLTADGTMRRLYVNGQFVVGDTLGGNFDAWLDGYRIAIGGEPTTNNSWLGSILMLAIYDRVLDDSEILNNFTLGADAP